MGMFGASAPSAEKMARKTEARELKRLHKARKKAYQNQIFSTTEGHGIAPKATISLGFDVDEEEDLLDEYGNLMGTGLIV